MDPFPPKSNPFPGLRPFKLNEEHLFFGREGQADELLHRLNRKHFLAIVGTSGSGKSSLVRAGLLPSLYSGFLQDASSSWRVAVLRPGNCPITNLAVALNHKDVFGIEADNSDVFIRTSLTESTLRRSRRGLIEVTKQARIKPHEALLVVVDQFEELFRFKDQTLQRLEAEDEASAFIKLLIAAVEQRQVPIFVVLTMRSDFLGNCTQFRGLPETLNDGQYLIPRMTREQLRQAIEGPITVSGAKITPRLVNRLLNDTGNSPNQLPILQHALMRTWDYWEDLNKPQTPIDIDHYKAIGGMGQTLSIHADKIYNNLPNDRSRQIVEILFKQLTEQGINNQAIRRPTEIAKICAVANATLEEVITVIDEFRAPRRSFLTPLLGVELTKEKILDISHESLIRGWPRLQQWVKEEEQSSNLYRRLSETASLHKEEKAELLRDPELTFVWNWRDQTQPNEAWAQRYNLNFKQAIQFLEDSIAARYAGDQRRKTLEIKRQIKTLGRFDIFLSFHREDKPFTQKLYDALIKKKYNIWVDWEDILPGVDWQKTIESGIEASDNIIFIVSPESLKSLQCLKVLEQSAKYNKRIFPIYRNEFDTNYPNIHPILQRINWVFLQENSNFDANLVTLTQAIDNNLDFVRLHTRLLTRALEWQQQDRDSSFLLRGKDLEDSERWLIASTKKQPEPTELHAEYISASKTYQTETEKQLKELSEKIPYNRPSLLLTVIISFLVTGFIVTMDFLGLLGPFEAVIYDLMVRTRPSEELEQNIVIVEVNEDDIRAQLQEADFGGGTLSDTRLNNLLQILESMSPRVIGLDFYRDFETELPELSQRVATNSRLIGICQFPQTDYKGQLLGEGIAPPPEIPSNRIGFSDVIVDGDSIVRRQLLVLEQVENSRCATELSFSLQLAKRYLALDETANVTLQDGFFFESNLFIGDTIIPRINSYTGLYQWQTFAGYQILINYRKGPNGSIRNAFERVSLSELLAGRVSESQIRDKLIIIGFVAQSSRTVNSFGTPYFSELPGTLLQAQMTSQLINHVIEGRPLIKFLSFWNEFLWISSWSLIVGLLISRFQLAPHLRALGIALLAIFCGFFYWTFLLIYNAWMPVIPTILSLVTTGTSLSILSAYSRRRQRMLRQPIVMSLILTSVIVGLLLLLETSQSQNLSTSPSNSRGGGVR